MTAISNWNVTKRNAIRILFIFLVVSFSEIYTNKELQEVSKYIHNENTNIRKISLLANNIFWVYAIG